MSHDSTDETLEHVAKVQGFLTTVRDNLDRRADAHDASKLRPPEKEAFDESAPLLKVSYPSPDYEAGKARLGDALTHHYSRNSHHPEHYPNGIAGMSLLDVVEMLADWKAASERSDHGDLHESLAVNQERFGISDQLYSILKNTLEELGW